MELKSRQHSPPGGLKLLLLGLVCMVATAAAAPATTRPARKRPPAAAATVTGTETASKQACADAAALRKSVADLDQLDLPGAGKAGLLTALQDIRTKLDALKSSAQSQWGDQVTELNTAIDDLQATIAGIEGDNLITQLPTLLSNLQKIDQAWKSLEQQIDQACP